MSDETVKAIEIPTPTAGRVAPGTFETLLASYELLAKHGRTKEQRKLCAEVAARLRADPEEARRFGVEPP